MHVAFGNTLSTLKYTLNRVHRLPIRFLICPRSTELLYFLAEIIANSPGMDVKG